MKPYRVFLFCPPGILLLIALFSSAPLSAQQPGPEEPVRKNHLGILLVPLATSSFQTGNRDFSPAREMLFSGFQSGLNYRRQLKPISISAGATFNILQGAITDTSIGVVYSRCTRLDIPIGIEWFSLQGEKINPVAATGISFGFPLKTQFTDFFGNEIAGYALSNNLDGNLALGAWVNGGLIFFAGNYYYELRIVGGGSFAGNVPLFRYMGLQWASGLHF